MTLEVRRHVAYSPELSRPPFRLCSELQLRGPYFFGFDDHSLCSAPVETPSHQIPSQTPSSRRCCFALRPWAGQSSDRSFLCFQNVGVIDKRLRPELPLR